MKKKLVKKHVQMKTKPNYDTGVHYDIRQLFGAHIPYLIKTPRSARKE